MGWMDADCLLDSVGTGVADTVALSSTGDSAGIADMDADTDRVLPDVTDTEVDQSLYPDFSNRIVCKPTGTPVSVFDVVPL